MGRAIRYPGLTMRSVRVRLRAPQQGHIGRKRKAVAACARRPRKDGAPLHPAAFDVSTENPFDRDQYDNGFAEYLVVNDPRTERQVGSLRLLRTDRPHLLGSTFPDLCDGQVPAGPSIREITQIFLSPILRARERRRVGQQLATALVEYGLLTGITAYTTVTELIWSRHARALGWTFEPLGGAKRIGNALLGAFQISIAASTIDALRAAGAYVSSELDMVALDSRVPLTGFTMLPEAGPA